MIRGFRPSWRMVLVGLDLGLGVFLTLVLAVVAAALVGPIRGGARERRKHGARVVSRSGRRCGPAMR